MSREEVITNMCHTWRHDFGLRISEDDRMYSLMSGMTEREAHALYNDMAQIYDNVISPLIETVKRYEMGTHIPIPQNTEQAKGMLLIAQNYLNNHT